MVDINPITVVANFNISNAEIYLINFYKYIYVLFPLITERYMVAGQKTLTVLLWPTTTLLFIL